MLRNKIKEMMLEIAEKEGTEGLDEFVEALRIHNIEIDTSFEDCKEEISDIIISSRLLGTNEELNKILDKDPLLLKESSKKLLVKEAAWDMAIDIWNVDEDFFPES